MEETAARLGAPYLDGTAEMVRRAEEARTAPPYREILDKLGAAWGVDWDRVDQSERLVLWDSIHPNAVGCRFLAEAVAERAGPMLAEKGP
ncbi:MAG: hypothetical protein K8I02_03520 [Candidatus Methylomirabilis sp.]|nr:hypothetical protein [Deltaproteobacteria bacterium]